MIENYKSGKMWKDVTVTYFTLLSRLDSNTVPAKGKSDTLHPYSNLASNGGYPEVVSTEDLVHRYLYSIET